MKSQYDVYMCREDPSPLLTVEILKDLQNPIRGSWNCFTDVYTAIDLARLFGYRVPKDILKQYDDSLQAEREALMVKRKEIEDKSKSFWAEQQKSATKSFVEKLVKTHLWPIPRKNKKGA